MTNAGGTEGPGKDEAPVTSPRKDATTAANPPQLKGGLGGGGGAGGRDAWAGNADGDSLVNALDAFTVCMCARACVRVCVGVPVWVWVCPQKP